MRTACLAIVIGLLSVVAAPAQNAEQDVRKTIEDGNAAARRTDKAGYARSPADDLAWVGEDGKEVRTMIKRDGRRQLVLHAQMPIQ